MNESLPVVKHGDAMKVYIVYTIEILNMYDEVISHIDRVTFTPPEDAIPETNRKAIERALDTSGGVDVYRETEVVQ